MFDSELGERYVKDQDGDWRAFNSKEFMKTWSLAMAQAHCLCLAGTEDGYQQ